MSKIQSGCQLSLLGSTNYKSLVFCNNNVTCVIFDGKSYLWKVHLASQHIEIKINWGQISDGRKVIHHFIQQNQITYMCHSQKFAYYFVFSDDWVQIFKTGAYGAKIYQSCFILVRCNYFIYPRDHLSSFFIISTDSISKFHINFVKDTKLNVGYNQQAFHLEVKEYKQFKDSLEWNKHCYFHYDPKQLQQSYGIIYNSHSCVVYKLETLTTIIQIKNIPNIISAIVYSQEYLYLIVGHISGAISIWRATSTSPPTSATHTFQGHQRQINSLLIDQNKPYLLYSASQDSTIKIWNIDTFTALFSYPLSIEQFEYVELLNINYFILQQEDTVYLGQLVHLLEYLYMHNSKVKFYDKSYSVKSPNPNQVGDQLERVQVAFHNNIIVSINSKEIENHIPNDPNKNYVNIFFAPPISQSIKSVHSSPFEENKYYMHFESGEICEWKIQDGKTLIESISSFKDIANIQGYPANQTVAIIKFLDILPCFFDVESKIWEGDIVKITKLLGIEEEDLKFLGQKKTLIQQKTLLNQLRLVALGCKKGSIIFLSLKKFHLVFARINFHKEEIYDMGVLTSKEGDKYLLSFSFDNYMKMITFDTQSQKPEAVKSIPINQVLTLLTYIDEYLIIAQKQSLVFFEISNQELTTSINDALNDHPSNIINMDLEKTRRLILTCSSEIIKILTFKGICLITIQLDLPMDMACFGNCYGDLLISLDGILCITRNIEICQSEEIAKDGIILKMEEYFSTNVAQIMKQKEEKYFSRQSFRRLVDPRKESMIQQSEIEVQQKNKNQISTSFNKEAQQVIKHVEAAKSTPKYIIEEKATSFILPAIPQIKTNGVPQIQQYILERKKRGPVKNRREWTMDKIILRNLAIMEQFEKSKLLQKNEY